MGVVTSLFARRMIQAAAPEVDGRAMLRSIGLDPDAPVEVAEMIAADAYYDLLERMANQMERGFELPIRVAPLMHLDDYGALGLAWKSAPTTRDSLERVARYCRVWTDNMTYTLRPRADGADFLLHREGTRRLGLRLSNEATIASAASLIRQTASPRFRPMAVHLRHPAPPTTTTHERYFGCPVHFGMSEDALCISDEALDRPNQLADEGISRFLLSHLDREVAELEAEEDTLETVVRTAISKALSDGLPRMTDVARRLGMSERTLGRRLGERDLSFKDLVESSQRDLARNLLAESHYSMSDVAFLTGFSEPSAFTRAFKRWTRMTPTAFRKERAG